MPPKHDSQVFPRLPIELISIIFRTIQIDAAEDDDSETIKACSLVSSTWRVSFQTALLLEMKDGGGVCLTFSNGKLI